MIVEADEILFGGGRGGGKTDAGIIWQIEPEYLKHPRYRGLVIRRNADDLKDWVDRAEYLYQVVKGKKIGQPTEFHFSSGSKIRTGHLNDADAYSKYQGHEYQKMLFEELTHIPRESDYEKILASNRSTIGLSPKSFATTNADGPGFKWVKKRFNIPDFPDFEKIYTTNYKGKKLVFIPSKLEDNPILMNSDPNYAQRLEGMSDEDMVKAWRHGFWSGISITGAYYVNQIEKLKNNGRYKPLDYDESLAVHTVWDLGIGQNLAIGFYQKTVNELRKIDYWEGSEKEGIPQAIKMLQDKDYLYGKHFAPHDIGSTEIGSGKTRYEIAKGYRIIFEGYIGENNKFVSAVPNVGLNNGIEIVRQTFSHLWVDSNNCEIWLDAISQYRQGFNEKLGAWMGTPVHDWTSHKADEFRYACLVEDQMTNDFNEKSENDMWHRKYNNELTKQNRYA